MATTSFVNLTVIIGIVLILAAIVIFSIVKTRKKQKKSAYPETDEPGLLPVCKTVVLTVHSEDLLKLKEAGSAFSAALSGKMINLRDRLVFENILAAVSRLEPEGPVKITDETNVNIRSTEEPVILRCKYCGEHQEKIQKKCSACGRELHYNTLKEKK